jgi:hypothetical protein
MKKNAKVSKTQKLFLASLKRKFTEDQDNNTWTKTGEEICFSKNHPTLLPELRQVKE